MATEFVYSLNRSDLVLRTEAEALLGALRCRTWGDLAQCVGISWPDLRQRLGDCANCPEATFDACEALMGGAGSDVIPDPYRAALREFRARVGDLSWHPVVLRHMEYGIGVAGSTAEVLSFDAEAGLKQVERVLRAAGVDVVFVRDERLFARLEGS